MKRLPVWLLPAPTIFLIAYGGNHFTPLVHLYEQAGHYAPWQANLLLGTYVFGLIPGLLIAASISDQHGRKPVVFAGVAASVAGSVLLAFGLSSFVWLCVGRSLAGLAVGVAMSVGTSWIKELSQPPFEANAPRGAGARRPSLTLTFGFAIGAGVTGVLAQYAPDPTQVPYFLHILLTLIAVVTLVRAPESLGASQRATGHWWNDLKVPAAGHRRFTRLVVPAGPWIFGAAGVAYAIMPATVEDKLGDSSTIYATVLTVLTLGSGALVQPFVARLDAATKGHALSLGMSLMSVGMGLSVAASILRQPWFALVVAVFLGCAYGVCVVAGLMHVQAIATPKDLAGLTGVYYSLAYAGFLAPTVVAALLPVSPYPVSLSIITGLCVMCLLIVLTGLKPQILNAPRIGEKAEVLEPAAN